jgi:hypothetical protein
VPVPLLISASKQRIEQANDQQFLLFLLLVDECFCETDNKRVAIG